RPASRSSSASCSRCIEARSRRSSARFARSAPRCPGSTDMCGIVGIVSAPGRRPPLSAIGQAMNDAIVHRGPDDEGLYVDDQALLAMRRLSIIDLATGHQPMQSEDGAVHLVFNGEIYNYREIRAALMQRGHRFVTQSDSEVVLRAYL